MARRVEAPTRRVEWRHADRALLSRQPGAVATDEADRPAGRQRADRRPLGSSRTCAGTRRPATIAENAPCGPPPGSGPTYGTSGPSASVAADWLGAIGPRGRVGSEVGQGADVELVRIGAVHEQPWAAADVDDAEEARALDRLRGDRDAGWLAARPGEDREAEPRSEHGDAPSRAAQRARPAHRRRSSPESSVISVSSGPRLIRKSASSAELLMKAGLVARDAIAVAEDEGGAARADGQPGRRSAARSDRRPSGRPAPRSGCWHRSSGARKYVARQLIGPVSVEIDGVHRVGDGADGSATGSRRSALPVEDEVVEEEAALARRSSGSAKRGWRTSVTRSSPVRPGGAAVAPVVRA